MNRILGVMFVILLSLVVLVYAAEWITSTQSNFGEGTYFQTFYNGTENFVQLNISNGFLSGNYTSKVFDSSVISVWNNISLSGRIANRSYLFTVDGKADFWDSINFGVNWSLIKDDYNAADGNGATYMAWNSTKGLFILNNKDIWSSFDLGVTWTKVNDDYTSGTGKNGAAIVATFNGDLFVISNSGQDVWKSTDSGFNWILINDTDFNGGNGNIKGIASNTSDSLFVVDAKAGVWTSSDGIIWDLINADFNGGNSNNADDMISDSNDNLYILHNQDVWKSTDSGFNWALANDDFNGAGDSNAGKVMVADAYNNLYIIDGSEDVFQSTDGGTTWSIKISNFNAANGNSFGIASLTTNSSIFVYTHSCDDASCSGESWNGPYSDFGLTSLSEMNNRYFQYKVEFTTQDVSISPELDNVTISYTPDNKAPTWITEPNDQILNEGVSLSYDIEATDNIAIDTYFLNDTVNFAINQSGTISNMTELLVGIYNVNISANDTSNNLLSKDIAITVQLVDLTSPVISDILGTVTTNSAAINWTTDESANSSINYGLTQGLGSNLSDISLVTSHSIGLTGLVESTFYYYNVTSCDASSNCVTNGTFNFTTSSSPSSPSGGNSGISSGGGGRSTSSPVEETTREKPDANLPYLDAQRGGTEEKVDVEETIQFREVPETQSLNLFQKSWQGVKRAASITGEAVATTVTASTSNTIITVLVVFAILFLGVYEERKIKRGRKKRKKEHNFSKNKRKHLLISAKRNNKKKQRTFSFAGLFKKKISKESAYNNLEKAGFKVKKSTKSVELLNVLQELKGIGNIEGSSAISRDGLIIASNISTKTGAEKFSATSALMIKSAETALEKLNKGNLNHIILNTKTKKVIATTAGKKAILVCMIRSRGNLGLMLLEVRKAANKISNILE